MSSWRWNDLTDREKKICYLRVVNGMKLFAVSQELGISRTRIMQLVEATYRILGVRDLTELAFEMGKHWKEIECQ
jgi:hypothetical protein